MAIKEYSAFPKLQPYRYFTIRLFIVISGHLLRNGGRVGVYHFYREIVELFFSPGQMFKIQLSFGKKTNASIKFKECSTYNCYNVVSGWTLPKIWWGNDGQFQPIKRKRETIDQSKKYPSFYFCFNVHLDQLQIRKMWSGIRELMKDLENHSLLFMWMVVFLYLRNLRHSLS